MQKVMSTMVLHHIETIEGLHEKIAAEYQSIERLGELVGDHFWGKEAKSAVEARKRARDANEESEAILGAYDLTIDDDTQDLRPIASSDLFKNVVPKLRQLATESSPEAGKLILKQIEQIERLNELADA